ncbi:hypothetical protein HYC85_008314 [Camellia sinensis]|uniref:Transcription initiation factor IIA gamma subunit N-terminal domain-containing protein n=1 Tax=Camellia sinensis TaxID=4442 RepID=A0A7J7HTV9_CAMSI|nr:hypothetical protein HYC85_008314 [Camellia sinensis]
MYINTVPLLQSHQNTLPTSPIYVGVSVPLSLSLSLYPRSSQTLSPQILTQRRMATFELYRRSTIGMCLTETLDEMVSNGIMSPELAIQVLVQFDKSMTEALEAQVKSKVTIKTHLRKSSLPSRNAPCRDHQGVLLVVPSEETIT